MIRSLKDNQPRRSKYILPPLYVEGGKNIYWTIVGVRGKEELLTKCLSREGSKEVAN